MITAAKVASPAGMLQRDSQARTSALRRFNSGCPLARVRTLQRMDELTTRAPTVPLEAGAGPDNPPCPACGEPLFGWLADEERLGAPVRRCESCGLGVVGGSAGTEEALAALERPGDQDRARIVDRASFACSLGGAGWAGLEPGVHYLFTVEAVRRLVAERDQVVRRRRVAPGAGLMVTWQTMLNSVTFGHNVALGGAWLGRGGARPGALAAAHRRPRQHRPGDPGGGRRGADRARGRRSSAAARSSTSASNCSRALRRRRRPGGG